MDRNSITPVLSKVMRFVAPFFLEFFRNPSSPHRAGREAQYQGEGTRERIAEMICAGPWEIVFTSCDSESDSQAMKGGALSGKSREEHIMATAVEHPAMLKTCRYLEKMGHHITYLPADSKSQ